MNANTITVSEATIRKAGWTCELCSKFANTPHPHAKPLNPYIHCTAPIVMFSGLHATGTMPCGRKLVEGECPVHRSFEDAAAIQTAQREYDGGKGWSLPVDVDVNVSVRESE